MKKLSQVLTAIVLSAGFVGNVAGAQAAQCTSIVITNTGPNSNNSGTCTVNTTVAVTCVNNLYVLSQNDQTAVTGQASSLGNTTAGTAITGNATNENGATVQIGAACGDTSTTTPETPATPTSNTPAGGAGQAEAKKVAALPYTASSSVIVWAGMSIAALLAALVATRIGFAVYRRVAAKQ